jgi:hypothetical protein
MCKNLTIQGRHLNNSDIEFIRRLISDNPQWHRTRLSQELCEAWDWRTNDGRLKDMACRTMLRKLQEHGLVTLPPARHSGNRPRQIRHIPHSTTPIQGDLKLISPIHLITIRARCSDDRLFHWLLHHYHYLGCQGHVGEHMKYLAFDLHNRPVACLLFGAAAWKAEDRDSFIGWDSTCRQQNLNLITNNSRFLILPWVHVPNLASHVLSLCLKRLQRDWLSHYGHPVHLVETFVLRDRFAGTCYQAANWTKIGQTKGRSRQDRHHRLNVGIKDIYVFPLSPQFRHFLCRNNNHILTL